MRSCNRLSIPFACNQKSLNRISKIECLRLTDLFLKLLLIYSAEKRKKISNGKLIRRLDSYKPKYNAPVNNEYPHKFPTHENYGL